MKSVVFCLVSLLASLSSAVSTQRPGTANTYSLNLDGECPHFVHQPLPYKRDALEPFLSGTTMDLHHGKHYLTYIKNVREKARCAPLDELLQFEHDQFVLNNAGQAYNHAIYFKQYTPTPTHKEPVGDLKTAIDKSFGSFAEFKSQLEAKAATVFGSGWVWLSAPFGTEDLQIETTANGNTPLREGRCGLLAIDLWEHAYYLVHLNRRDLYVQAGWEYINWEYVSERFANSKNAICSV